MAKILAKHMQTNYTLDQLINGEVQQQLNTKLYTAGKVAYMLGITQSYLSKLLSRKYSDIKPIKIGNITVFTQEQLHHLLKLYAKFQENK